MNPTDNNPTNPNQNPPAADSNSSTNPLPTYSPSDLINQSPTTTNWSAPQPVDAPSFGGNAPIYPDPNVSVQPAANVNPYPSATPTVDTFSEPVGGTLGAFPQDPPSVPQPMAPVSEQTQAPLPDQSIPQPSLGINQVNPYAQQGSSPLPDVPVSSPTWSPQSGIDQASAGLPPSPTGEVMQPFSSPAPQPESFQSLIDTTSQYSEPQHMAQPPMPSESAPTDLSNLVGSVPASTAVSIPPTPITSPETIVVPTTGTPEESQVMAGTVNSGQGFPKWIFAVGGLILILIAAISAYFILGIGKSSTSSEVTTSLPAEQQVEEQILTSPPQFAPAEGGLPSAGTDTGLSGSIETTEEANPPQQPSSSALDRLKQRRGEQP